MYDSRIIARRKGKRYDKRVIPFCAYEMAGRLFAPSAEDFNTEIEVGTVTKVGQAELLVGEGYPRLCDELEVRIGGWVVPAYRIASEDNSYCICQRLDLKSFKE